MNRTELTSGILKMKILSPGKQKESLVHVVTTLMNLPERNNLLQALICDMDGEENLDIYRLITMSEEEIEGLEYTPDGAHGNAKPTKLITVSRHKFVTLWACTGHETRQEHLLKIS